MQGKTSRRFAEREEPDCKFQEHLAFDADDKPHAATKHFECQERDERRGGVANYVSTAKQATCFTAECSDKSSANCLPYQRWARRKRWIYPSPTYTLSYIYLHRPTCPYHPTSARPPLSWWTKFGRGVERERRKRSIAFVLWSTWREEVE